MIVTCVQCGKREDKKPSRANHYRTCSRKCMGEWYRLHPTYRKPFGKGYKIVNGYRWLYAPGHPRATKTNPYVREHILVIEKFLGHEFPKGKQTHHINGDKLDNRIENLQVIDPFIHNSMHHKKNRKAKCHPERPHLALGLCQMCYHRQWSREHQGKP